jgi:ribosomal protein S18 acetylase RimI-like enzyme
VADLAPPPAVPLEAIRRLEARADLAWPAAETVVHDGWQLRSSGDIGRRVNSVTAGDAGVLPLDDKVAHAEAFYRERCAPPCFKLTAAARPPGLDRLLAARGYRLEAPAIVHTRRLEGASPADEPGDQVMLAAEPDAEWLSANARHGGHGSGQPDLFARLLERISLPTAFAAIVARDMLVATGMAVADDTHVGLFEIVTDPGHRGRGLAGTVVDALLTWGIRRGAVTGYLQVMADNVSALRLYRRRGFTEAYRYWYRLGS